jgi:1A family penicillin-binding protein
MPRSSTAQLFNLFLIAVLVFAGLALIGLAAAFFAYSGVAGVLPSPQELQDRANTFKSTAIYDRQGGLLYEIFPNDAGRRILVPLASISPNLINAVLATEDPNFYRHPGVDPAGVARALYYALRRDSRLPGGSGIPQQLVKLTYLSADKTLSRKLKEAVLAIEISRRYDKDKVLEIYLNHIFYGNLAYGAEAAAQTYFAKPARDLSLAEASLIAGIAQYPALYDPYTNWQAARNRQGDVLRLMVQHGFITPAEATTAWMEYEDRDPSTFLAHAHADFPAPHFVLWLRQQLEDQYGPEIVSKGGLRVLTTLDPLLQRQAELAVSDGVEQLRERGVNARNAALVALDPASGEILALVGSPDFDDAANNGQVNMAVQPRQTGSVIKPLTYLAAFERPTDYWTPATLVQDEPTAFPDGPGRPPYTPKNYDGRFHGPVSIRSALANSYNIPAVKALQHVGVPALKTVAARLGVSTLTRPDYGLSLTLGGGEVSPLEMTAAFAAFANGGWRVEPHAILTVQNEDGDLLFDGRQPARWAAIAPEHAYLITSILSDAEARRPAFGAAARWLELPDRPVAAKTGTTDDWRDGWTVGYTPLLVAGVWVGNADNTPMSKDGSGAITAAPIWRQFMQQAHEGRPAQAFARPPGVIEVEICADTGAPAGPDCPNRRTEVFKAEQPPTAAP